MKLEELLGPPERTFNSGQSAWWYDVEPGKAMLATRQGATTSPVYSNPHVFGGQKYDVNFRVAPNGAA